MLKLTHNVCDYYELNIANDVNLDDIKLKLTSFVECTNNIGANLALSFSADFNCLNLESIINEINVIASTFGLSIAFIKPHHKMQSTSILNIPILSLHDDKRTQNIFNKTLKITNPVRSGAIIKNDGDIIVTNFVSNGAQIIATGNIHVYGELRGRVIAGANGDKSSQIFALNFNPELIAIGGIYRVIDSLLPDKIQGKPVIVSLDEYERLKLLSMDTLCL